MDATLRPDTPHPPELTMDFDLRTPSATYNHGGYYAPSNPRDCTTPGGPCSVCQDRIDAEALLSLLKEPCPDCHAPMIPVTHESRGLRTCNGCPDTLCSTCFDGARYFCPLRTAPPLAPPTGPLERQQALGVQSPKAEEKGENK